MLRLNYWTPDMRFQSFHNLPTYTRYPADVTCYREFPFEYYTWYVGNFYTCVGSTSFLLLKILWNLIHRWSQRDMKFQPCWMNSISEENIYIWNFIFQHRKIRWDFQFLKRPCLTSIVSLEDSLSKVHRHFPVLLGKQEKTRYTIINTLIHVQSSVWILSKRCTLNLLHIFSQRCKNQKIFNPQLTLYQNQTFQSLGSGRRESLL